MLVNHLLLAFAVHDNGEVIKRFDDPPDLKAVRQVNGNGDVFFAKLVQKIVLNVDGFVHGLVTPFKVEKADMVNVNYLFALSSIFPLKPKLSCYYSMNIV